MLLCGCSCGRSSSPSCDIQENLGGWCCCCCCCRDCRPICFLVWFCLVFFFLQQLPRFFCALSLSLLCWAVMLSFAWRFLLSSGRFYFSRPTPPSNKRPDDGAGEQKSTAKDQQRRLLRQQERYPPPHKAVKTTPTTTSKNQQEMSERERHIGNERETPLILKMSKKTTHDRMPPKMLARLVLLQYTLHRDSTGLRFCPRMPLLSDDP